MTIEFEKYDALDLAEQVARKEITPAELVDVAISCIERVNGQLNCVNIENYELPRKTAGESLPDGPFRGVSFDRMLETVCVHSQRST